jgi:hypothetical protein
MRSEDRGSAEQPGMSRTVSSEDVEEIEEQRVFNVAYILSPRLLESRAVYNPSLTYF